MRKLLVILTCIISLFWFPGTVDAQEMSPEDSPEEQVLEGTVVKVQKSGSLEIAGQTADEYLVEIAITRGFLRGSTVPVAINSFAGVDPQQYKVGDKVMVVTSRDAEGNRVFYIGDFVRREALLVLSTIFVIVVLVVAKMWGLRSLLGLLFSFFVIFWFILPQINAGKPPLLIALIGSGFILVVTYYLSHGFSRKTHIALISTLCALLITGILTLVFTELAKLTGFASEEATFLSVIKQGNVNIKGLLLAGIIIGTLGVLDDITISQSAVVMKLKQTNPKMKPRQIFWHAMEIGHDHIASLVNTLILVYAGSAFPLLLLFVNTEQTFMEVINYEPIAEEIVRTLVGSIGLVLAVPITTFLAAYYGFKTQESVASVKHTAHGHYH